LLLGAVLVVLFSGNQLSQIAFGCTVAFLVALVHAKAHPYREEDDNELAFAANFVVALTFFVGLVLYADADEGRYDDSKVSFGALLILLNLSVVAVGCALIAHDRFGTTARGLAAYCLGAASRACFSEAREARAEAKQDAADRVGDVEMTEVDRRPEDARSRWRNAFNTVRARQEHSGEQFRATMRSARLHARTGRAAAHGSSRRLADGGPPRAREDFAAYDSYARPPGTVTFRMSNPLRQTRGNASPGGDERKTNAGEGENRDAELV